MCPDTLGKHDSLYASLRTKYRMNTDVKGQYTKHSRSSCFYMKLMQTIAKMSHTVRYIIYSTAATLLYRGGFCAAFCRITTLSLRPLCVLCTFRKTERDGYGIDCRPLGVITLDEYISQLSFCHSFYITQLFRCTLATLYSLYRITTTKYVYYTRTGICRPRTVSTSSEYIRAEGWKLNFVIM